jgi:hypothetical protein
MDIRDQILKLLYGKSVYDLMSIENDIRYASNEMEGLCKQGYVGFGNGLYYITESGKKFIEEGGFTEEKERTKKSEQENIELKKLQMENLTLNNENLNYQKTIRNLNERLLFINVIKSYWWLWTTAFGIGCFIANLFK